MQYQHWSPISFTRICTDSHSDVIKQYIEYSHQYERTCTERGAIRTLQKYHEHTTKIIYSLIDRCGGTVASTDDDMDVDVDVDEDDAVAVPIPASGIEEDPDDDVVEAVVITQTETPDTSDLISSGNQYLVAFTEAMINMAKKNRSKGGRRTKNPPSEIPQYIQDQATIIIRKEFSEFQASDSIHSTRILKSVITAAWSSINTQIDQSDTIRCSIVEKSSGEYLFGTTCHFSQTGYVLSDVQSCQKTKAAFCLASYDGIECCFESAIHDAT